MTTHRIPVVSPRLGLSIMHVKDAGLARAFHPALVYVLSPSELRRFPEGRKVVDLIHVLGPDNPMASALRRAIEDMGMEPIPLIHLTHEILAWEQQQREAIRPAVC